jgi:transcriptional regulator with XRE-family HTH domain
MKHPFDAHVGARLKLWRRSAGLTREEFGRKLGLEADELRSIEEGENRIDPALLRDAVAMAGVSPAFLFEGLAEALRNAA